MAKKRKINMAAYRKQFAEEVIGPDSLVEVEVNHEQSVWLLIPVGMDEDEVEQFQSRMQSASVDGMAAMAMVVLSGHPTMSAEEQWQIWSEAGGTADELITAFTTESVEARERLGNFRYKG